MKLSKDMESTSYNPKHMREASAHEQIDVAVLALVNLLAHQAARELASESHSTNLKDAPYPDG